MKIDFKEFLKEAFGDDYPDDGFVTKSDLVLKLRDYYFICDKFGKENIELKKQIKDLIEYIEGLDE